MGWLVDGDYQPLHRKKLNILAAQISGTPTNIPLAIVIASDTGLAADARSDGHDLAVTKADGTTELDYERVAWNEATGALEIWFKAPDPESGDVYYLYYGDADQTTDRQDATGVWSNGYELVLHFSESSGDLSDSSSNAHTAVAYGDGLTYSQTGAVGKAVQFAGSADYFLVADHASLDFAGDFTLEAWADPDVVDAIGRLLYRYDGTSKDGYDLTQDSIGAGQWQFVWFVNPAAQYVSSDAAPSGAWEHIVGVRASGTGTLYIDGAAQASSLVLAGAIDSDCPLYIGRDAFGSSDFAGLIDELRLSSTNRSANWVASQHNNQKSAAPDGTFWSALTTGTIQTITGAVTSAGIVQGIYIQCITLVGAFGAWRISGLVTSVKYKIKGISGTLNLSGVSVGVLLILKDLSGAVTSAGAIVKKGFVAKVGGLTSAGALIKKTLIAKVGGLTSAGALIKKTLIAKVGALTSSGIAQTVRTRFRALTGALTSSGTILKKTLIAKVGGLPSSGVVVRLPTKMLSGVLASAGTLARSIYITLIGALSSSGVVAATRFLLKALAGALTAVGTITRRFFTGIPLPSVTRHVPHIFWRCPLCDVKVIWFSAWVHLRDVHSLNVSVSTDIRSLSPLVTEEDVYGERTHYWCPICYRVSKMTYFHTKADLISHLKVFHT